MFKDLDEVIEDLGWLFDEDFLQLEQDQYFEDFDSSL